MADRIYTIVVVGIYFCVALSIVMVTGGKSTLDILQRKDEVPAQSARQTSADTREPARPATVATRPTREASKPKHSQSTRQTSADTREPARPATVATRPTREASKPKHLTLLSRPENTDIMIGLVKKFEGFEEQCYNDAANYATIGYGHLIERKPCVSAKLGKFSQGIDREIAEDILREDLEVAIKAVSRNVKVGLDINQYSALASFTYNLGETNFRKSTLLRKLNEKDYTGAAKEFKRWVMANGKRLTGLKRRRACETETFLGNMEFTPDGDLNFDECISAAFTAAPVSDPLDIVFGE